ncbi:MAG: NADH-quinone oxidoreductase subunit J family protein [Anaerolineales bacterium]
MTGIQIIFIIVAAVTLGAGLMSVITRNLVHAALWLVLTLFGVAIFFVMLNASFLAVAQVVIYIGAIAILMIFAIMMTRRLVTPDLESQFNTNWIWATVIAVFLFGGLVWLLAGWSGFSTTAEFMSPRVDPIRELGTALVSPSAYVIPFEVASVLLLAALIGAIMVAWDRKS